MLPDAFVLEDLNELDCKDCWAWLVKGSKQDEQCQVIESDQVSNHVIAGRRIARANTDCHVKMIEELDPEILVPETTKTPVDDACGWIRPPRHGEAMTDCLVPLLLADLMSDVLAEKE